MNKLVARPLDMAALWVRTETSLKIHKMGHKQSSGQHTLAATKKIINK